MQGEIKNSIITIISLLPDKMLCTWQRALIPVARIDEILQLPPN